MAAAQPRPLVPVDQEMSLAEVLRLVDAQRSGLQDCAAAVQANDLPRAQQLLMRHFATRTRPVIPPAQAPGVGEGNSMCVAGKAGREQAETWLKHVFTLSNNDVGKQETTDLGPDIQWLKNPSESLSWILYLNQLNHLNALAGLYRETKDEKLAREVGASVLSWSQQVPAWYGYTNQGEITPSGMEVRNRLSNLIVAYDLVRASPSLTAEMHLAFWKVFITSARELMKYDGVSYPGLIYAAVMFPEFTEAPTWLKSGEENLRFALVNRTSPEGAWDTQSISYQTVPVPWSLRCLEFLQANPESGDFTATAEMVKTQIGKLLGLMLWIAMPNGGLPNVGDTYGRPDWSDGHTRQLLTSFIHSQMTLDQQAKLNAVPDHYERLLAALAMSEGTTEPQPRQASCQFPGSGYTVMRSGWEPQQARYLYLDLTPQAMGHAHNDAGHFDLYAYGKPLLADTGDYFLGWGYRAALHNTIEIDGRDQARGPKALMMPHEWLSTAAFDFADVAHGAYEGLGVTHRRKLLFVKPDYFVLCDLLTGDGSHRAEQFFHFAGKTQQQAAAATLDDQTLVAASRHDGSANVQIVPAYTDGLHAELVPAQDTDMKPEDKFERQAMLGWMVTDGCFQRVKAPVVAYSREGRMPQAFYDVLYPTPAGAKTELIVTTLPVHEVERKPDGKLVPLADQPVPPTEAAALVIAGTTVRPRYSPDQIKLQVGPNLAAGKSGFADINQGQIAATTPLLTDGDRSPQVIGGAVSSGPYTPNVLLTGHFGVDLGQETEVNTVVLHHGTWNGSQILYVAEKLTVQSWDGAGWREVPGQQTTWPTAEVSQTTFPVLTTARLRVAVERSGGGRLALREIEVHRVPEAELLRVATMRTEMTEDSFRDICLISHTGKGFRQYGSYLFDGELALIRMDGAGSIRQVCVKDADYIGDSKTLNFTTQLFPHPYCNISIEGTTGLMDCPTANDQIQLLANGVGIKLEAADGTNFHDSPDGLARRIRDARVQLEPAQPGFAGAQPSALVTWKTPLPATSQVFYGEDGKLDQRTPLDARLVTDHAVRVHFLRPDRPYTFRATSAARHAFMQAELTGKEVNP